MYVITRQYVIVPGTLGSRRSGRSHLDGEKLIKKLCFEFSVFVLIIKLYILLRQKINNIPT